MKEHARGSGSGYTSQRLPLKLVFAREYKRIKTARGAELKVKKWSRKKKEALVQGDFEMLHILSQCRNKSHYSFNPKARSENV